MENRNTILMTNSKKRMLDHNKISKLCKERQHTGLELVIVVSFRRRDGSPIKEMEEERTRQHPRTITQISQILIRDSAEAISMTSVI